VIAFLLPAHIVIAALAFIGTAFASLLWIGRSVMLNRRLPVIPPVWWRSLLVTAGVGIGTLWWGFQTDHTLGRGGAPIVAPFNFYWVYFVGISAVGGATLYAIVFELWRSRGAGLRSWLYVGTIGLVGAGAVFWGARLGEFTAFHAFYGAIGVFVAPIAAVAIWSLWRHLGATRQIGAKAVLGGLITAQLAFGGAAGVLRLQEFGAIRYPPIPLGILDAIRALPPDAKLAYSCKQTEEIGFGTPQLLSIDAHTSRRVIPMCFAAEKLSAMVGARESDLVPSLYFVGSPQRDLYPSPTSRPSGAEIERFLKDHGIHYIYADTRHPNALVPDAVTVAEVDGARIMRIP
jgi:hypothetical protein